MEKSLLIKQAISITDVGVRRIKNEDFFAAMIDCGFFALADGMGGHKSGEIAAKEAVNYLCNAIKEVLYKNQNLMDEKILEQEIKKLFENANEWIYRLSRTHEDYLGMGTTLCSLLIHHEKIFFGNIGDSRIYCLRRKKLYQITDDHAAIVSQKGSQKKKRKVLTQVIGSPKEIQPQIGMIDLEKEDLYLICSDGLSDFVPHDYLQLILNSNTPLQKKASLLVETAKTRGSNDNITVILIET